KLAPGEYLVAKRGSMSFQPRRYWDVPLHGEIDRTRRASCAQIIEGLRVAVAQRLVSDVPLGAFLSGGVDSSAVVAMMRDIGVEHLLTCSIGFREREFDESSFASKVACEKATDHKTEVVEASDYGLLERLAGMYDEPFADSSAIPTYRVCELARK